MFTSRLLRGTTQSLAAQSLAIALAISAFLLPAALSHSAQAQEEHISKATATKLLQAPLEGVEGKEVHIVHFSAPPGFVGERHTHPGPVYVYILEGQLTLELEGMETKVLGPGDLYQEPVNTVMKPLVKSSTHGVKLLVFQINNSGQPLMLKAE